MNFISGETKENYNLIYQDKDNNYKKFDINNLDNLIYNGEVASFGINSELITDLSYRNALMYETDKFIFEMNLSNILNEIQKGLKPDFNIYARRYRMNIYQTGGMFKEHKDTPKGDNHFGTLIIVLPVSFEGGELFLDNKKYEFKGDKLEWIAFYNDINHKIEPVKSGTRITITYDLFFNNVNKNISPKLINFSKYKDNHINIYNCKYNYSNACDFDFNCLKGEDYLFYKGINKEKYNIYLAGYNQVKFELNKEYENEYVEDYICCYNGEEYIKLDKDCDILKYIYVNEEFDGYEKEKCDKLLSPSEFEELEKNKNVILHYVSHKIGKYNNIGDNPEESNRKNTLINNSIKINRKKINLLSLYINNSLESTFATYGNEPSTDEVYMNLAIIFEEN